MEPRVLVILTLRSHSLNEGNQDRNSRQESLEAGAEAETPEESCLLAFPQAHSCLSYISLDRLPWDGAAHSRLGPPTSVIRNMSCKPVEANRIKAFSQLSFYLPDDPKLTKTNQDSG